MVHLQYSIEIHATADRVWDILTDFAAYPAWNPFVRSIEGAKIPGSTLKITVQPEGGTGMSFEPRLLSFAPGKELRWRGKAWLPGIFDGEHYFQLDANPTAVRFTQGETFSGLLVPLLFRGAMRTGTERGFQAMNRALKIRAETAADSETG
jgi:hypothetical protein